MWLIETMKRKTMVSRSAIVGVLAGLVVPQIAVAQDGFQNSYTLYGTPGLIDMPTALSEPDGRLSATLGYLGSELRTTFTFQLTPRLSGSFRYTQFDSSIGDVYDRSFDLRYRVLDEGRYWPALAVGLQDFMGTGLLSGEYVVATKTLSDNLRVSGGLGWGRFGSYNGFSNPLGSSFETRPDNMFENGGSFSDDLWFRGDAAVFGGVEYRLNDKVTLIAEYSSDAYEYNAPYEEVDHESPVNFGVNWRPGDTYDLGLAFIHGNTLSLHGTVFLDPMQRPSGGGFDPAPIPVASREGLAAAASWDHSDAAERQLIQTLAPVLGADGIILQGMRVSETQVRLRYENDTYRSEAQALGRIARVLTQVMPASVETFVLEPTRRGVGLSATTLQRRDLEQLANQVGADDAMFERAQFAAAGDADTLIPVGQAGSPLTWGIAPYAEVSLFDGSNPIRGEFGLELSGQYVIRPNLVLSGAARKAIYSGFDDEGRVSDSTLPLVRRDVTRYSVEGDPSLEYLTLAHYGRLTPDIYSRVTFGYLERMYGGLSTELLWKPVNTPLSFGAELNVVAKRDYNMGFGFQDIAVEGGDPITDPIFTGHVSAYYDFDGDWIAQVDLGQYLAGDIGATVSLSREFDNGWSIGGYFTLTDVDFDDFGEGSFDKGIRVTIPFDWVLGAPSRREVSSSLASLTRDGGARLSVEGRLYDVVRDAHVPVIESEWGRFWR